MIFKFAIIFLLTGIVITALGVGFGALMLWMDERIQGDMDE